MRAFSSAVTRRRIDTVLRMMAMVLPYRFAVKSTCVVDGLAGAESMALRPVIADVLEVRGELDGASWLPGASGRAFLTSRGGAAGFARDVYLPSAGRRRW